MLGFVAMQEFTDVNVGGLSINDIIVTMKLVGVITFKDNETGIPVIIGNVSCMFDEFVTSG